MYIFIINILYLKICIFQNPIIKIKIQNKLIIRQLNAEAIWVGTTLVDSKNPKLK
jgi:hypothetical protein